MAASRFTTCPPIATRPVLRPGSTFIGSTADGADIIFSSIGSMQLLTVIDAVRGTALPVLVKHTRPADAVDDDERSMCLTDGKTSHPAVSIIITPFLSADISSADNRALRQCETGRVLTIMSALATALRNTSR